MVDPFVAHYRLTIDALDDELLQLLEKRFEIALEIGRYQKTHNLAVRDPIREKEIIDRLTKDRDLAYCSSKFVRTLWMLIFDEINRLKKD